MNILKLIELVKSMTVAVQSGSISSMLMVASDILKLLAAMSDNTTPTFAAAGVVDENLCKLQTACDELEAAVSDPTKLKAGVSTVTVLEVAKLILTLVRLLWA